ncbi:hypothetical protein ATCC51562_1556 [Campylobacter concisus ATCC 51562]|uniref:Uncharacterized protein n=1 Tax=Campylobacter concisus ATCC 51562 TaxID=1242969 RepID=U2GGG7_9BACT|nr:hypothetical protein ATCC51562_1556 [Campylobacter concisus ATCC 51562]
MLNLSIFALIFLIILILTTFTISNKSALGIKFLIKFKFYID